MKFRQLGKGYIVVLSVMLLVSCVSVDKPVTLSVTPKIKPESRQNLLNWHDAIHKSYYGLKGPVHTVLVQQVVNAENPEQVASDGWELQFNRQGRLARKKRIGDDADFETTYAYSEQGQLTYIASSLSGKLWRTTNFIYENKSLVRVDFIDRKTGDKHSVRNGQQRIADGWFEIQYPVEKTELPGYTQFASDGRLLWSNKGDINNGLGEQYYLRTVDGVTSSSVVNEGTAQMAGRGGYRYKYETAGLLQAVESYNAHNNRLFHTTSYRYNDLQLLVNENKKVVDSSPFNQAIDEHVDYRYQLIDDYGNWLERQLDYQSKFQSVSYPEKCQISYFQD